MVFGGETVILMGPPASGKGTQAVSLAKEKGFVHISTGDLLRENVRQQTEIGKQVKEFMDAGKLVPEALVIELLKKRLEQDDAKTGVVLDGFPRTLTQAEELEKLLQSKPIVVSLEVPDEELIKRSTGRRSCSQCQQIYHIYFNPPKQEGICDQCQGALIHRSDDTEVVVKERLNVYREHTAPVLNYYRKQGVLHTIDGNRPPKVILEDIQSLLNL
ncbi:MAG: adenylate kinase [Chlamydiia bacterium]|nr:adenylate kinase [Chlamydiia bacterium]